ncbi:hypothetical protein DYU11_19875 [Fibrisoma montanum]|uniref:Uncharacterized protein n=1 Tax=Fibrisoma montanum TaxID=2305895 RepID=A0A418M3G8_9BACT|nr:hypothetical protein DYU11_19875 [Fibrisoma montanum]
MILTINYKGIPISAVIESGKLTTDELSGLKQVMDLVDERAGKEQTCNLTCNLSGSDLTLAHERATVYRKGFKS